MGNKGEWFVCAWRFVMSNAGMTREEKKLRRWPSPVSEPRRGSDVIYAIRSNEDARSASGRSQSKDITQTRQDLLLHYC